MNQINSDTNGNIRIVTMKSELASKNSYSYQLEYGAQTHDESILKMGNRLYIVVVVGILFWNSCHHEWK